MREQKCIVREELNKTSSETQLTTHKTRTRPSRLLHWDMKGWTEEEGRRAWLGSGMRCAGHRRSGGPRYLLGSREGMVEARHISHNGFLIWPSSSDDVCRETDKELQLKLPSEHTVKLSRGCGSRHSMKQPSKI